MCVSVVLFCAELDVEVCCSKESPAASGKIPSQLQVSEDKSAKHTSKKVALKTLNNVYDENGKISI